MGKIHIRIWIKFLYTGGQMFSESKVIMIREPAKRTTRDSEYFYVVEGNEFVHISEYAIRNVKNEFGELIYEVPIERIPVRLLYGFSFSNSGSPFLRRYRIEDFEDGRPVRYDETELLKNKLDSIHDLRFRIKNSKLKSLLEEFDRFYKPMIKDLNDYAESMGFRYYFHGHSPRLEEALNDLKLFYFTSMSLPDDKSRIKSFNITMSWIYKLWVLKSLCHCLDVTSFSNQGETRSWLIEQGSNFSTCIANSTQGKFTFWLGFQLNPMAHVMSMSKGEGIGIRPDIVGVKGKFKMTKEFVSSGKAIDLLVKCVKSPSAKWNQKTVSQILAYKENFSPNLMLLVSLYLVPDDIKGLLSNHGIEVIERLRPGSESLDLLRQRCGVFLRTE